MTGRARDSKRIIVCSVVAAISILLMSCASPSSNNQPLNLKRHDTAAASPEPSTSATQTPIAGQPPASQASETPPPENTEPAADTTLAGSYVGRLKLIIPVQGVRPDQLQDTFMEARTEGRVHDAIDIPAAAGTPVLAAADGEIAKLFQSERGGTTIYQYSNDKRLVFYYAHLQRYADGLAPGKFVHQGEVIAYVGDTGNAGAGNYHLHFSISVIPNPTRYWEGTNINPYPLLRNSQ
ncbi:MAG TPA: M23 family metallopeptidase [Pyrinomonadaceae bacterium]